MSNMVFDSYTLVRQPNYMTILHDDRDISYVKTHSSVHTFSWGLSMVGKEVEIRWNYMPTTQYAELLDIYQDDDSFSFNPNDSEGYTYTVEMLTLTGEYLVHLTDTSTHMRQNIIMSLLVLSQDS